jgi:hypothetical protein
LNSESTSIGQSSTAATAIQKTRPKNAGSRRDLGELIEMLGIQIFESFWCDQGCRQIKC